MPIWVQDVADLSLRLMVNPVEPENDDQFRVMVAGEADTVAETRTEAF